ncbi:hypothetical protein LPB140_00140 [Sphingorhabdus lutea]|uniref:Uncharacterized protein n=2 Tax=Sphingorhabdus lutea TaxID=1913578 RepID=A0A1L3J8S7_9SPHN|nr:hypothetical protein LPB140_00140 [Sphingorhabdus lutea]
MFAPQGAIAKAQKMASATVQIVKAEEINFANAADKQSDKTSKIVQNGAFTQNGQDDMGRQTYVRSGIVGDISKTAFAEQKQNLAYDKMAQTRKDIGQLTLVEFN